MDKVTAKELQQMRYNYLQHQQISSWDTKTVGPTKEMKVAPTNDWKDQHQQFSTVGGPELLYDNTFPQPKKKGLLH